MTLGPLLVRVAPVSVPMTLDAIASRTSRDVRWYTKQMSSHGKCDRWAEALLLLPQMREEHIMPNVVTYSVLISACEKGRQADNALQLFGLMHRDGLVPDVIIYSALISACEKGAKWQHALHLLGQVRESRLSPNVITYSAAVSACEKGEQWQLGLRLLAEMREQSLEPNLFTYNAAISACHKCRRWEQALNLLHEMQQQGLKPDVISCGAAISACGEGGRWDFALQLLGDMHSCCVRPNVIAHNAAIGACVKGEQWEVAMWLLAHMALQPNVFTYSAAISACEKGKRWEDVFVLLLQLRLQELEPDVAVYNTAMSAFEKLDHWEHVLWLLVEMPSRRLEPDVATHSIAISACTKGDLWEQALSLFRDLSSRSLATNVITHGAAIHACKQSGQWLLALDLLTEMKQKGLEPGVIIYGGVVTTFKQWIRTLNMMTDMKRARIQPDMFTHNEIVSTGEWDWALQLLVKMRREGLEATGLNYGAVMSAMNVAGCWQRALIVMRNAYLAWVGSKRSEARTHIVSDGSAAVGLESPLQLDAAVHVLKEGTWMIAALKPSGVPTEIFLDRIKSHLKANGYRGSITRVSRLDFMTSGVLVVALGDETSAAANLVRAQFAGRLVSKEYLCLCAGETLGYFGSSGEVKSRLCTSQRRDGSCQVYVSHRGQEAHTQYKVLGDYKPIVERDARHSPLDHSGVIILLVVKLLTGRRHQIRTHLQSIGRPLVSDQTYNARRFWHDTTWCARMFLHCRTVELSDLMGPFVAKAPLLEDLQLAMTNLRHAN